jgi:hypothetical protein
MIVTVVDEKAGTEMPGILVEYTHDGSRGTVLVLDPSARTVAFVPRIPAGSDNAYIDDDGKHGQYFREGDPLDWPGGETDPDETEDDELAEDETYG